MRSREIGQQRDVEMRECIIKVGKNCLYTLEMGKISDEEKRSDGVMSFTHDRG